MATCRICVVGATGAVGQEMLRVLERSDISISELRLLASARSAGIELQFRGQTIAVQEVSAESFESMAMFDVRLYVPVSTQIVSPGARSYDCSRAEMVAMGASSLLP